MTAYDSPEHRVLTVAEHERLHAAADLGPEPTVYALNPDDVSFLADLSSWGLPMRVMVTDDGLAFRADGVGSWSPPMGTRQ